MALIRRRQCTLRMDQMGQAITLLQGSFLITLPGPPLIPYMAVPHHPTLTSPHPHTPPVITTLLSNTSIPHKVSVSDQQYYLHKVEYISYISVHYVTVLCMSVSVQVTAILRCYYIDVCRGLCHFKFIHSVLRELQVDSEGPEIPDHGESEKYFRYKRIVKKIQIQ